jgi:hypothetical protein
MLFVFLLMYVVTVFSLLIFAVWPRSDGSSTAPDEAESNRSGRSQKRESLEGVLVTQLAAAEISRRQYLHAMECLAARDEKRRPLAVPDEAGPAT